MSNSERMESFRRQQSNTVPENFANIKKAQLQAQLEFIKAQKAYWQVKEAALKAEFRSLSQTGAAKPEPKLDLADPKFGLDRIDLARINTPWRFPKTS